MVKILFFVDGEDCGADEWPAVPRVGDKITFSPAHHPLGSFHVAEVVWQLNSDKVGDVAVHVHMTPAE